MNTKPKFRLFLFAIFPFLLWPQIGKGIEIYTIPAPVYVEGSPYFFPSVYTSPSPVGIDTQNISWMEGTLYKPPTPPQVEPLPLPAKAAAAGADAASSCRTLRALGAFARWAGIIGTAVYIPFKIQEISANENRAMENAAMERLKKIMELNNSRLERKVDQQIRAEQQKSNQMINDFITADQELGVTEFPPRPPGTGGFIYHE